MHDDEHYTQAVMSLALKLGGEKLTIQVAANTVRKSFRLLTCRNFPAEDV